MSRNFIPPYIALCGFPEVGKSTVADILAEHLAGKVIDDFAPMRRAAISLYGLSDHLVNTQEGKATIVNVMGQRKTVRELLGELGVAIEEMHGPDFIPWSAMNAAKAEYAAARSISYLPGDPMPDGAPSFIFPSCRRTQGRVYKDAGGVVIEIRRPGHGLRYEFDRYDTKLPDATIENDIPDLGALKRKAIEALDRACENALRRRAVKNIIGATNMRLVGPAAASSPAPGA